ncbi:alpha-L-fucosidase [Microbacterium sp. 179-I 3D3 NHS]|uniref:alpha-L-fucosidase n=1 Tax=Microbacterium sp. 179-I 3D3 NHS TaxID=3142382 RepID=UPI0039A334B3
MNNRLETSGGGFGSLVTDRPEVWAGDFVSPEMIIPAEGVRNAAGDAVPWEACVTHNNHWGYVPGDTDFKSPAQVVRKLVECVSKGGNLLLNVGPNALGEWPVQSVEDFAEVGEWLRLHGESIYGAGPAELPKPDWGRYTKAGGTVYAHVMEPPIGPLHLVGIPNDSIVSLRWLHDGTELRLASEWVVHAYPGQAFVALGPEDSFTYRLPNLLDSVIAITMRE